MLHIARKAIDLSDMLNQPNSIDNRRLNLACYNAIDKNKKQTKKKEMKNPIWLQ